MEVIIFLVLAALAIYVFVNFILPVAGIITLVILGLGASFAFGISISCFVKAVSEYIDPYLTYTDAHAKGKNSKRNYFFGPGFHQMKEIIAAAFTGLKEHASGINEKREDFTLGHSWFLNLWVSIFFISALAFTYVFGTLWVLLFSILLIAVILTGMALFYVMFSLLWLADRISLLIRSINSRCPQCKRRSIIPLFECPSCEAKHDKLTPGPYGVFYRKCDCGKRLPTTVFLGRSRLAAYCPYCQEKLASGGARQFGIQLVGGSNSGKTTFLAAFQHVYQNTLRARGETDFQLSEQAEFDRLEDLFRNGVSSSTSESNAIMYNILRHPNDNTPLQMTFYDIAGEVFQQMTLNAQGQQQLAYCEGIIFVIDPTGDPDTAADSVTSLVTERKQLKGTLALRFNKTPVAVLISKADLFKREIGLTRIYIKAQAAIQNTKDGDPELIRAGVQNQVCLDFLKQRGFGNVIGLLESDFPDYRLFPVSAIGHIEQNNVAFEPWGVEAPVQWLAYKAGVQY